MEKKEIKNKVEAEDKTEVEADVKTEANIEVLPTYVLCFKKIIKKPRFLTWVEHINTFKY